MFILYLPTWTCVIQMTTLTYCLSIKLSIKENRKGKKTMLFHIFTYYMPFGMLSNKSFII